MSEKVDAHKEKRTFVFIVIPKSSLCSTRRCARWQSFGVPSEKWGETPLAAVILQRPGEITEAELCRWINERVDGKHQRVQAVVFMEDFPRSTAGKTLKREMREPYWAGRAARI